MERLTNRNVDPGRINEEGQAAKRSSLFVVMAVGMLCIAGCMHCRYSALSSVEGEVQKIATRHRYTLVGVKHAAQTANADVMSGNLQSLQFSNDSLKQFQPNVFLDDGIPFMYCGGRTLYFESQNCYGWTKYLYLLTLCAMPQCYTTVSGSTVTIDVLDNPDARATFEVQGRYYQALALTPSPFLFYVGDASPSDNLEKYSVAP